MNPVEIIKLKRDGFKLTSEQINFLIEGFMTGIIPDYQMSSFLMAVYFKGLDEEETIILTDAMINSGIKSDLSFLDGYKVDKHSTGGVGDKTSIILAPQVSAAGIFVPMISGKGLGYTGGTLDKLESIPNFNINLTTDKYKSALANIGVAMIGQTAEFAPADKMMYALRDVTATVDSIPLIIASILSKKIAEGADGIVFDVKIGNGSNIPDEELAYELAKDLVHATKSFGKKAIAVCTDMNEPLGYKIGNWLEVEECIEVMNGKNVSDLIAVNNIIAGAMIFLAGKATNIVQGEEIAVDILECGNAYSKFLEMVGFQSGDVDYVKDFKNPKRSAYLREIRAEHTGYLDCMNAKEIGLASVELGCGRKRKEDIIDYLAGIELKKKCGDPVNEGETILTMWADSEKKLNAAEIILKNSYTVNDNCRRKRELIKDIID